MRVPDYHTSAETPRKTRADYLKQRFLEMVPGILVWGSFILPFVLFFFAPRVAVYVFFAYVTYWFARYLEMTWRQIDEYRTLRRYRKVDWHKRLDKLHDPYSAIAALSEKGGDVLRGKEAREELEALRTLAASGNRGPKPEEIFHLVILVTYNESAEILEQSLDALVAADYPKERMAICVAAEERAGRPAEDLISHLKNKYQDEFGFFFTTLHPDGIPGEGRVKGANLTWGAKYAREELHKWGILDGQVIVSAFDADTRASRDYFSVLTYKHITNPNRDADSYQPVLMFHNNIWDVPAVSRLIAFGSTFWTMIESTRPRRLRLFSSHAIGMPALVAAGYWSVVVIPDDSRQYWRMFFASNGRGRAVPLHTPLYMDAVLAANYFATLKEQYLQLRRWAYGIIDFPYIMEQNTRNNNIPFQVKAMQTLRQVAHFHSWATTPILLFVIPQLSRLLEPGLRAWETPHALAVIASNLLVLMPFGVLVSMTMAFLLLPPRPPHRSAWNKVKFALEWLMMPLVILVFLCMSAIDAQTRLIFRRYIGFRVTIKNRRSHAHQTR